MIVNAAVFTCSICGEASTNICAYCTKDACSNHRCERCKRCSDCCECEFPLSAEESAAPAEVPAPVAEAPQAEPAPFLTPEEASVFAEPFDMPGAVALPEPEPISQEQIASDDPTEPHEQGDIAP